MNALLWIVVLVVGIIVFVLVPFFALSYLLAAKPHSKKKTAEQARLDKRTGNTTISTDATPEQKKEEDGNKLWEWTRKNFWLILLVLSGVIVFFYGKSPDLADVGSWSRNHWLLILILWGIVAWVIALNAGKAAKTLQTVLAIIVFALFIGFPIIGWLNSGSTGQHKMVSAQANIPLTSAPVADWPKWILPSKGKSAEIPVPPGMHIVVDGNRFDLHTVYEDGHENIVAWNSGKSNPDGPITKVYVTNQADEQNIVSYAFSK